MSVNWWSLIRDMLCKFYQECGGDCADLGTTPAQAVVVTNALAQMPDGPAFDDAESRQRCLNAIQASMLVVNAPGNGLSSSDKTSLWGALAALKSTIIANTPGDDTSGGGSSSP